MSGKFPTTPRLRWIVFVAAIAIVAAACSGSAARVLSTVGNSAGGGGALSQDGTDNTYGPALPAPVAAASAAPEDVAGSSGGGQPGAPLATDLLVIKTGSLALQVKAIDAALADASAKIAGLGGYVSGSQRGGDGQNSVASVTYRIPAARWDDALVALRGLAQKVVNEQTQSEEVTGQVIDLGARIDNLQATERALQAIMDKAVKISDVLEVQAQLTDVRGQIEQLETEKKHLEEQSAFGTLSVTFGLETVAVAEAQKSWDPAAEADRATASLVEVGQGLAAAGIWFGIFWLPMLLGFGLIALIVVLVVRRIRRDRPAGPSVPWGPSGPLGGGPDIPVAPGPITPAAEA